MNKPHQRIGSRSNAHVGKKFELIAKKYFENRGIRLSENLKISVGINQKKKDHAFDLGSVDEKILVECKSHKWTKQDYVPSAKMTIWNEAMYYFSLVPRDYKKIMFVLRDHNSKYEKTLADYYLQTNTHLIPDGVIFLEFDEESSQIRCVEVKNGFPIVMNERLVFFKRD